MGQSTSNQNYDYYKKSGYIHVSEFGGMMAYYQWWPKPYPNVDPIEDGQRFCDDNGIPRTGEWCKIGDFSRQRPELYEDIKYKLYREVRN